LRFLPGERTAFWQWSAGCPGPSSRRPTNPGGFPNPARSGPNQASPIGLPSVSNQGLTTAFARAVGETIVPASSLKVLIPTLKTSPVVAPRSPPPCSSWSSFEAQFGAYSPAAALGPMAVVGPVKPPRFGFFPHPPLLCCGGLPRGRYAPKKAARAGSPLAL